MVLLKYVGFYTLKLENFGDLLNDPMILFSNRLDFKTLIRQGRFIMLR